MRGKASQIIGEINIQGMEWDFYFVIFDSKKKFEIVYFCVKK